MQIEIGPRYGPDGGVDPAAEVNVPWVSLRSHWPFVLVMRDDYWPWSLHLHLPGKRTLHVRCEPRN